LERKSDGGMVDTSGDDDTGEVRHWKPTSKQPGENTHEELGRDNQTGSWKKKHKYTEKHKAKLEPANSSVGH